MEYSPQEGMRIQTVLSALALILALMQGVLALESTAPARISLLKARLLLALELAELVIILASEVFTFFGLSKALNNRLQWLQWLAPAVLALGVCELVIDGFLTFRAVSFSRSFWVPLSALGGSKGVVQVIEFICLLITGVLSFILVVWRQAGWWRSTYVSAFEAVAAAENEPSLEFKPFALCFAFAFTAMGFLAFIATVASVRAILTHHGSSEFRAFWTMRKPEIWSRGAHAPITPRMRRQYELLVYTMQGGEVYMDQTEVDAKLNRMPLHVGNMVIGADAKTISNPPIAKKVRAHHGIAMILKQIAVMPFLMLVVVTISRMYKFMDKPTYDVFEELADAATVVVLQEFAMGLKTFIWRLKGVSSAGFKTFISKVMGASIISHPQDEIELLEYK